MQDYTLIMFKNSSTMQKMIGFRSVQDLEDMIRKAYEVSRMNRYSTQAVG